ncbi:hypothetical protein X798_01332 [Onchocerca flexuosa]|uniref:Uncharacterized protein n=1 Tax=Onchocerca flexuosa TaxID=387005 RepID=A0A238C260_9BILA|nr:hypothetical protein X798_01332 [Onchocerca flexuosa]
MSRLKKDGDKGTFDSNEQLYYLIIPSSFFLCGLCSTNFLRAPDYNIQSLISYCNNPIQSYFILFNSFISFLKGKKKLRWINPTKYNYARIAIISFLRHNIINIDERMFGRHFKLLLLLKQRRNAKCHVMHLLKNNKLSIGGEELLFPTNKFFDKGRETLGDSSSLVEVGLKSIISSLNKHL